MSMYVRLVQKEVSKVVTQITKMIGLSTTVYGKTIPPPWSTWIKNLAHTRLPSVWFQSWSRFLAVSLQVTQVINPVVGCHYFPPGLQLPSQPLRGLLPILLLGEQRHDGCKQLAYDCCPITRQRRSCNLNPGPSASESSTLTTRLPSHPCWMLFSV